MFRQADGERGITTLKGGGGMWRLKFYKAYAKYGLPVFVTFDGGKTTMQVVNAELMKSILTPGVEDAKEEMDAIHGNG